jgi:hypothetical protein
MYFNPSDVERLMTENVACQLKFVLVPKALGGIKQYVLFCVVYVFVCISHCSLNRFSSTNNKQTKNREYIKSHLLLFLSGMKL